MFNLIKKCKNSPSCPRFIILFAALFLICEISLIRLKKYLNYEPTLKYLVWQNLDFASWDPTELNYKLSALTKSVESKEFKLDYVSQNHNAVITIFGDDNLKNGSCSAKLVVSNPSNKEKIQIYGRDFNSSVANPFLSNINFKDYPYRSSFKIKSENFNANLKFQISCGELTQDAEVSTYADIEFDKTTSDNFNTLTAMILGIFSSISLLILIFLVDEISHFVIFLILFLRTVSLFYFSELFFIIDDFVVLKSLANAESIFGSHNGHVIPTFKLLIELYVYFFEYNLKYYYLMILTFQSLSYLMFYRLLVRFLNTDYQKKLALIAVIWSCQCYWNFLNLEFVSTTSVVLTYFFVFLILELSFYLIEQKLSLIKKITLNIVICLTSILAIFTFANAYAGITSFVIFPIFILYFKNPKKYLLLFGTLALTIISGLFLYKYNSFNSISSNSFLTNYKSIEQILLFAIGCGLFLRYYALLFAVNTDQLCLDIYGKIYGMIYVTKNFLTVFLNFNLNYQATVALVVLSVFMVLIIIGYLISKYQNTNSHLRLVLMSVVILFLNYLTISVARADFGIFIALETQYMYWGIFGITPMVLYFLLNKYYRPVFLFLFIAGYSGTNYNVFTNRMFINEAISSRATMDAIDQYYNAYCVNTSECKFANLYISSTLRKFTPNNNGVITKIDDVDLIKIHKYIKK